MDIVVTDIGLNKIANATVDSPLILKDFAVGDGNGNAIEPKPDMTTLVNEKFRTAINTKHAKDNNIVIECVISSKADIKEGFYLRELGIFDSDNNLIVIAKLPESYRPAVSENIATELSYNVNLQISNSDKITIKINEQVFATVEQVNRLQTSLQNQIMYIVCQDIRTEDSATITLTTDAPITELKEGMTISFIPKFNSQAGVKIKINDLAEVEIKFAGFMSLIRESITQLMYHEGLKSFLVIKMDATFNNLHDLGENFDFNNIVTNTNFVYGNSDKYLNIPTELKTNFPAALMRFSSNGVQDSTNIKSIQIMEVSYDLGLENDPAIWKRYVFYSLIGEVATTYTDWVVSDNIVTGRLLK